MPELEKQIEQKFIEQLCSGESQWTYRPDITTEEKLWANFKYILEQNNKAVLNDTPLTDEEFAKIKNDVSHPSFYESAKWLVGENGKVLVHINRGNETLHLCVIDNLHIAGGTSTYEVINQYQAFKDDESDRDRRFDVTLLINGVPMIHVELKNRQHSCMEGFNQISKYIKEGKFKGLYSNVQLFIVSNAAATRYFAPARDYELNKKLITGWVDEKNCAVDRYLDFADAVLRIPTAHEMIAKYIVLDDEKKRVIVLRPYQIHAIEAVREASKHGESGYVWHTTGSGKTLTSYKATRNLLMDIPSLDKTVFLVDRKELDNQTGQDFKAYAQNDIIDVNDTDYTGDLIRKLADGKREMIVTTRQKLQTLIKKVNKDHKYYDKLTHLKVAFVVDECHRAVTPETKRDIEDYFRSSLWYGFTGTPIMEANPYPANGDLPRTTEELYGRCLHSYTIKEAIKDNAVLGFQIENLGAMLNGEESDLYNTTTHRRTVLNHILNKSAGKLGLSNGPGKTYSAILSVDKIEKAQAYYRLLKAVKEGRDELKIDPEIKKAFPDFPRFAITYSVTENDEKSNVDQEAMKESLADYNTMFGTDYKIDSIQAYNTNLSDRLSRRTSKYSTRDQQLDIVIVVDRLLTGFNAPTLSTLYLDRAPMSPQLIIQAFSRTNRLLDAKKMYGQIVTFQDPEDFKKAIDAALTLYSNGGSSEDAKAEDWDTVLKKFKIAIERVRLCLKDIKANGDIATKEQKKAYISAFRSFDHYYAHLQNFTGYSPAILADNDLTDEIIEEWMARYKNYLAEVETGGGSGEDGGEGPGDGYELVSVNRFTVNFDYIIALIGAITDSSDDTEKQFEKKVSEAEAAIAEFAKENAKLAAILTELLDQIKADREKFINSNISEIVHEMCEDAIYSEAMDFSDKWFIPADDVVYEIEHYRDGQMANAGKFKEKADYAEYKASTDNPVPKFKFTKEIQREFEEVLMPSVSPLVNH